MPDRPTLTFDIRAGAMIRGRIKREIMSAAWACGCDIAVKEAKAWGMSAYHFVVTGPTANVLRYHDVVMPWLEEITSADA